LGCGGEPVRQPLSSNVDPKVIPEELRQLEGVWFYELQIVEGRVIPAAENTKDTITFRGDTVVRTVTRPDGKAIIPLNSKIAIDPTVTPKQMDDELSLPIGKSKRLGIYSLEGDRLKLCYDNKGKQRPTEFESKPGTSIVLTVLRRQDAK
jgi:uncharacterized protein (TIGR03067 family)